MKSCRLRLCSRSHVPHSASLTLRLAAKLDSTHCGTVPKSLIGISTARFLVLLLSSLPFSCFFLPPPQVSLSVSESADAAEKRAEVNSLSPCLINTATHPASRHPLLHPRSTLPFPPRLRPFNLADDFLGPRPPRLPRVFALTFVDVNFL